MKNVRKIRGKKTPRQTGVIKDNTPWSIKDIKAIESQTKLREHQMLLSLVGIDMSEESQASILLKGTVAPRVGVCHPTLFSNEDEGRELVDLRADFKKRGIRSVSKTVGKLGRGTLIGKNNSGRWKHKPSNTKVSNLPSELPIQQNGLRSSFPADRGYIYAPTLILSGFTSIVISPEISHLVIIAKKIIVDDAGVDIIWQMDPSRSVARTDQEKNYDQGKEGELGKVGFQGDNAPNIEIWTENTIVNSNGVEVSSPIRILLPGQNGGQGGKGQNGGPGSRGKKGDDSEALYKKVFKKRVEYGCNHGPRDGHTGKRGANGGSGGIGGVGGNGGDASLYVLSSDIGYFNNNVTLENPAGEAGAGGIGGDPGIGGPGGYPGRALGFCANSNYNWRPSVGPQGPSGYKGQRGDPGSSGKNGQALQIFPLAAGQLDTRADAPGIYNLNKYKAEVGDTVEITGIQFKVTDTVFCGNELVDAVLSSSSGLYKYTFTVPDIVGGTHMISIENDVGQISNTLELHIVPTISEFRSPVGQIINRVKPGTQFHIIGTGLAPDNKVFFKGFYEDINDFISPNEVLVTARRPNGTPDNRNGEPITVMIGDTRQEQSNSKEIVLKVKRILCAGTSIIAGQGHPEANSFPERVGAYVRANNPDIGVYYDNNAHSGAVLIRDQDQINQMHQYGDALREADKEIPRPGPEIGKLFDEHISAVNYPEDVDLIIMDGGVNDVGMAAWMTPTFNPFSYEQALINIDNRANIASHNLYDVLVKNGEAFPNAKMIVTGYYQVITHNASPLKLLDLLQGMIGLSLAALDPSSLARLVEQSKAMRDSLHVHMQAAIARANSHFGRNRIKFIDPDFGSSNGIYSPNSYLFDVKREQPLNLHLTGSDHLVARRDPICAGLYLPNKPTKYIFCKCAGAAHPNNAGSQRYYDKIIAAL